MLEEKQAQKTFWFRELLLAKQNQTEDFLPPLVFLDALASLAFKLSLTPMSDIFFQGPHDITRYFGFLYDIRYYHTIFAICPILSKMRVNCRKCDISVKFVKSPYNTHKANQYK